MRYFDMILKLIEIPRSKFCSVRGFKPRWMPKTRACDAEIGKFEIVCVANPVEFISSQSILGI